MQTCSHVVTFLLFPNAGSTGRSKSKSSGGVPRSRQSVVSSLPRTPKGEDILFRPPTVELESSSSSDEYEDYELDQEFLLPSIGPPAILQYMKESQHPPLSNEEVEDRQELAKNEMLKKSLFSGPCMFCQQEVLPFPTMEELERLTPDQVIKYGLRKERKKDLWFTIQCSPFQMMTDKICHL